LWRDLQKQIQPLERKHNESYLSVSKTLLKTQILVTSHQKVDSGFLDLVEKLTIAKTLPA